MISYTDYSSMLRLSSYYYILYGPHTLRGALLTTVSRPHCILAIICQINRASTPIRATPRTVSRSDPAKFCQAMDSTHLYPPGCIYEPLRQN